MDNLPASAPHILLIDDDHLIRETLAMFFEENGWRCDFAASGKEGIEAAGHCAYDVVITDLMMPDVDGMQVLKTIRKNNPGQNVMVITGAYGNEMAIKVLREGAVDFLTKPIDFEFLTQAIRRISAETRKHELANKIYAFIKHEETSYEIHTKDIVNLDNPFVILDRLFDAGVIDLHKKLKILLALQEALTNNIDHGNLELESRWKESYDNQGIDLYSKIKKERLNQKKYAERKIFMNSKYDGARLVVKICDEGNGFDVKEAMGKKAQDGDGLVCSGRGLTIINGTIDKVVYSKGGREIRLEQIIHDDT